MAYFSNGTEGMDYQANYCDRCVYWDNEWACPIWVLHERHNYDGANNKDHFLHKLIPRDKDTTNKKCSCFTVRPEIVKQHAEDAALMAKYNEAMKQKKKGL